eukprot:gene17579-biopygen1296
MKSNGIAAVLKNPIKSKASAGQRRHPVHRPEGGARRERRQQRRRARERGRRRRPAQRRRGSRGKGRGARRRGDAADPRGAGGGCTASNKRSACCERRNLLMTVSRPRAPHARRVRHLQRAPRAVEMQNTTNPTDPSANSAALIVASARWPSVLGYPLGENRARSLQRAVASSPTDH